MTVKEYLGQGYRLEHRIRMHKAEIEELKELSVSISSPGTEEHYSSTRNTAAPFEKVMLKIMEMESEHAMMLQKLLTFKQELNTVIDTLEDKDEKLVLHYRYISNLNWVQIGDRLGWDARTVRRWHDKAVSHVALPEEPMIVDKKLLKNESGT